MGRSIALPLATIILGTLGFPSVAEEFTCTVSHIRDGDTFECSSGVAVRVSGINAAESGHDTYDAARDYLSGLILGETLLCIETGTTFDRVAAICSWDGYDVGASMVAAGYARDCPRYSGGAYANLEDERHTAIPKANFCY